MKNNINTMHKRSSSLILFFISFLVFFLVGIAPLILSSDFNPDYYGYKSIYDESGAWLEGGRQSLYVRYSNWHKEEFNSYGGFRFTVNLFTLFLYLVISLIIFRITKLQFHWVVLIIFCIFFHRNIILLRENLAFLLSSIGVLLAFYAKPNIIAKPIGISFISISPFFHTGGILFAFMYFFRNLYSVKYYNYFLCLAIIIPAAIIFFWQDLIIDFTDVFAREASESGWNLLSAGYFALNIFLAALLLKLSFSSSIVVKKLNLATMLFIVIPSISILFTLRTLEIPPYVMVSFSRSLAIGIHFLFLVFCLDLQRINNTFKLASIILLLITLIEFRYYNW